MGVPVGTSIGKHLAFREAEQVESLKPWGVFRKLEHLPLDEQRAAYLASLDRREQRIRRDLEDLTVKYRGQALVLLCWETPDVALAGGCHRRWAADWFATKGLDVPELRQR